MTMVDDILDLDLSIIIPCYNVQDYIKECLNSIVQQQYLPKEILCIDDGSTDNTAQFIQAFANQYPCVKYIYQTNQGVSQARNHGLNLAKGSYIQFVDPDDILHPDLLQTFFKIFNDDNQVELFYFENESFEDSQPVEFAQHHCENLKHFRSGNELFNHLVYVEKYPGACWKYIFNKALLTETFEGRNHEDHLITLNVLFASQSSYYSNFPYYYYRKRANSLTNNTKKFNKNYIVLMAEVINKCVKYVQKQDISEKTKTAYINFLRTDYLFNINIYYLHHEKPKIMEHYFHIYNRLYIKNKLKVSSNILYVIRYCIKNKISFKHAFIFLMASLNKDFDYFTKKINNLLEQTSID